MDGLDIKHDRAGIRIRPQIVNHIAEIDVIAFAQRDKVGKPDSAGRSPIQNSRTQGPGLRDKGDLAAANTLMAEAGIKANARHHQAKAIWTKKTHLPGGRDIKHRLFDCAVIIILLRTQARSQDNRGEAALFRKAFHDRHNTLGRDADHCKFRNHWKTVDVGIGQHTANRLAARVNWHDWPVKATGKQVFHQNTANRVRAV